MKNRTKMILNVSTLLLAGVAIGVPLPAGALGSFGWHYAGFHCSCAGTPGATSVGGCKIVAPRLGAEAAH